MKIDKQGHGSYVQQLMWLDQKAEDEEHAKLHDPCHSIKEDLELLFPVERLVAYDYAGDVDCQVAVAVDHLGDGHGEDGEGENQDGVERQVPEVDMLDEP